MSRRVQGNAPSGLRHGSASSAESSHKRRRDGKARIDPNATPLRSRIGIEVYPGGASRRISWTGIRVQKLSWSRPARPRLPSPARMENGAL